MAEEKPDAQQAAAKKKLPLKTLIILAVVMVVEGGVIFAAFMLAGPPAAIQADDAAGQLLDQSEQPVEVLVVKDRFQNTRSGVAYLYETEVYVVILQKYKEQVDADVEGKAAQINTSIAQVFRRADPSHLLEPALATVTRQVQAALDAEFERAEDGESVIKKVLLKVMRYAADM